MTLGPDARPFRSALLCGVTIALSLAASDIRAQVGRCRLNAEQIYERTEPKVMEIFSDAINQFRVRDRIQSSLGTGFLMGEGKLVTNYHVIADAQRVEVYDGSNLWNARVLGVDPLLDIAVLDLYYFGDLVPAIAPAGFDSVRIGQTVFAIGYPRGLGKSITQGIVTGTGRVLDDSTSAWLSPFVQTDATVNPGNSGGPLLDDCGRVIGMVSRVATPELVENTAFAIPIEVLKPIVDEIIATGHVSRAWHGLYGQMVDPAVLALLGLPPDEWQDYMGFMVETVEPGSAADQIGLEGGVWPVELGGHPFVIGGDIITEVNGIRIEDRDTALNVVRGLKVGDTVSLVYKRGDGAHSASIKLPERPILEADLDRFRGR